ncbi:MAG: M20/M25/M40 family metallo-hydrolase [Thermoplasmatota archaeon]
MRDEVRFLSEIVSIDSPTGSTNEVLEGLAGWCVKMGLKAEDVNGALVINPGGEDLLLLGHMDTVPGNIPVRIDDKELWGRGSVDAKGPLCAAICALSRIEERSGICLVAVPDEEGSSGTARMIAEEWKPRPVVILEPSGLNGITIQYNGRLLIELTSTAERSHSGSDEMFASEKVFASYDLIRRSCSPRILRMEGGIEKAEIILDIRYEDEPVIPDTEGIEVKIIERIGMCRTDKRSPLARSFLRSMRSLGMDPVFKRKTGTCDMNIIGNAWDTPVIAYGPGDGRLDHTNEERINIDEYLRSIDVLEGAIRDQIPSMDP